MVWYDRSVATVGHAFPLRSLSLCLTRPRTLMANARKRLGSSQTQEVCDVCDLSVRTWGGAEQECRRRAHTREHLLQIILWEDEFCWWIPLKDRFICPRFVLDCKTAPKAYQKKNNLTASEKRAKATARAKKMRANMSEERQASVREIDLRRHAEQRSKNKQKS